MSSNSTTEISFLRRDRLRIARERRGLTQRELAALCGIGENQINKYENRDGEPSARVLYLLAQQLDVSVDYLLGLSDVPQNFSAGDLNDDERALVNAFKIGDAVTLLKLITDRVRQLEAEKE